MIDNENTFSSFGYQVQDISDGSNREIILVCDYCGSKIVSTKKKRNKSNIFCDKDSCNSCKYKKREEVSIARYGVKNSSQKQEIRNKISDKNSDRLKSAEHKARTKQAMMERYGVEYSFQSESLKEKYRQTNLMKYGYENPMQSPEILSAAAIKSKEARINSGTIRTIDGKSLPDHAKEKGWSRSHFFKLVNEYGFDEALKHEKGYSSLEKSMSIILEEIGLKYDRQYRIDGSISDFKVSDLLIECDGLYWHSDLFLENRYHYNKRKKYEKNAYRSLFIREDEIRDKKNIVTSIIKNAAGINKNKLYARKLKAYEIDTKESHDFMDSYHLMGGNNSTSFAYSLDGVSVIEFKRIKDNDYDIARFCTLPDHSIVGGFSKLISHFIKIHKPSSISTFIDLRYGTGKYLSSLGFEHVSCYPSFKWTDGKNTYHRLKFPGNSGYLSNLYKIWDCGQSKYIKRL